MCVVSVISEIGYTHALFHVLAMQMCTMGSSQFPITKLFYPGDVNAKGPTPPDYSTSSFSSPRLFFLSGDLTAPCKLA